MNRHERGVWLCVVGLFLTVAIMGNPPGSQTYGDTDGNGVVDDNDVQAILRVIRGETDSVPNSSHFEFCDIDQDGGLTLADAEALRQHLQGESLEVMATSADGQSTNLETGSVVYVRVSDKFFPYLMTGGTIHIRSRAAGYDSGELRLTHEQFGGSYFYRWYTAKCKPASDYELTVAVSKRDKAQKEKRLAVRLSPPAAEEVLLLAHSDLHLPYWDIGTGLSRLYRHHSANLPRAGAMGTAWTHSLDMRLEPSPDGSVAVYSPEDSRPSFFVPKRDSDGKIVAGSFVSPLFDKRKLFRDPDGTFWVRDPGGVTWELKPRFLVEGCQLSAKQEVRNKWKIPLNFQVRHPQPPISKGVSAVLPEEEIEIHASNQKPVVYRLDVSQPPAKTAGESRFVSTPGDRRRLTRDSSGLLRVHLPDGPVWLFRSGYVLTRRIDHRSNAIYCEYDGYDRLIAVRDDAGQRLEFHYLENSDRLSRVSDSTGRSVEYSFDKMSNLTEAKSAKRTTRYGYDTHHRLNTVELPGHSLMKLTYDDSGRLSSVSSDKDAGRIEIDYGEHDLTARIRTINRIGSAGKSRIRKDELNSDARLIGSSISGGVSVRCQYNDDTTISQYGGESALPWSVQDDNDRRVLTDPLGSSRNLFFAQDGAYEVFDQQRARTRLEFITSGYHARTIYPDKLQEINRWKAPTEKDKNRTVDRELRNGQTNHYVFDARGLLLSKSFANDFGCTYAYDARGNLIKAVGALGSIAFQYDEPDLPCRVECPGNRTFLYDYDVAGRRTKMTDPDGLEIFYEYDVRGQLVKISSPAQGNLATFEYNFASDVTSRRLRNGVVTKYEYDGAGRVRQMASDGFSNLGPLKWQYEYDAFGELAAVNKGDSRIQFEYDACGRLTRASDPAAFDERFKYDTRGNRTELVLNSDATAYATNSLNQYESVGGAKLHYDSCGNVNSSSIPGRRTYEYDAEGRLWRVLGDGGFQVVYGYDAIGRLASRASPQGKVHFLWDADRIALVEDSRHVTLQRYVWGLHPRDLLEAHLGGKDVFCIQDMRGHMVAASDSGAALIQEYRYRAFGQPIDPVENGLPFLFKGAFYDPQTDLYYLRMRWYSPMLGRFLHVGSVGHDGTSNRYSFSNSNPNQTVESFFAVEGGILEQMTVETPAERAMRLFLPLAGPSQARPALQGRMTALGERFWRDFVRQQLDFGIR